MTPVIAIDGPSGVGKGTAARAVARRLDWHFLDSGALYRVLAIAAQSQGISLQDGAGLAKICAGLNIRFIVEDDDKEHILLDGYDITSGVRTEQTGALASTVAALPEVRAALLGRQRAFRQPPGLVADGRDMGTVVFPDAVLKMFLDASPEERARRRFDQLSKAGINAKLSNLCDEIRERDVRDRTRSHSPLKAAADAVTIDTTELPIAGVLSRIESLLIARGYAT